MSVRLALAVALVSALPLISVPPVAAAPLVRATADTAFRGAHLPRSFQGISQEYNQIETFTGNPVLGYNGATGALMRRLASFGDGPAVLRVGGASSDSAWWNPDDAPRPDGIYYNISPRMLAGIATFAGQADAKLLMGLNLAYADHSVPVAEAQAMVAGLPAARLLGLEVGNEPDFYSKRPSYTTPNDETVYTRPPKYTPARYGREVQGVLADLSEVAGIPTLSGPATALDQRWVAALGNLLAGRGKRFGEVSLHAYLLNACTKDPSDPLYASLARLVSPAAEHQLFGALQPALKAATKAHRTIRITESGPVACGGRAGVSNTQGAALWSLDFLYGLWLTGVSGVNFHASSPLYRPFGTFYGQDKAFHAVVGPVYYGMLAFGAGSAGRSELLKAVPFTARARRGSNVSVWGAVDPGSRTVRVMVINKSAKASGLASIRVPGARSRARVERLTAPGLAATSGFAWAGQSYATPTDGQPVGRHRSQSVHRRSRSRFSFRVGAASAALLTVRVSRLRRQHH